MRYEMEIILDAFRLTFKSRQKYGEILKDYKRQFQTSTDIS